MPSTSFERGLFVIVAGLLGAVWLASDPSEGTSRTLARISTDAERGLFADQGLFARPDTAVAADSTLRLPSPDSTASPAPSESAPAPVVAKPVAAPPIPPPSYPLSIPVAGISADDLVDTFGAPRDSTRTHRAIDILAPTGTPVVATADGRIVRTHTSALGGLTVYQAGPDSAWVFYYAHLDRYADGLQPGQRVSRGDTLGFVGATGNAPVPHLHFAVWKTRPGSRRLWSGRAVNPFPLLRRDAPPR